MIEDLLTTKQLQELLKIDRITIYRMLSDGRLKGIKVGTQWRFPVAEVEKVLQKGVNPVIPPEAVPPSLAGFPKHCIQAIQDVVAEIGEVAVITVDFEGQPLTDLSQPCAFCQQMQSNPTSRQDCLHSWKEIASHSQTQKNKILFTCHAGLNYMAAPIFQGNQPVGCLLTGQFHLHQPEMNDRSQQIQDLVNLYHLPIDPLSQAFDLIPVLDKARLSQVSQWPEKIATSIMSILDERASILNRLQRIAEISSDLSFSTQR